MNKVFLLRYLWRAIIVIFLSFIILSILLFLTVGPTERKQVTDCIPDRLPSSLKLHEIRPVKYKVVTVYYNQDILGNFFNKVQLTGQYTRGLPAGTARWNAVMIANAGKRDELFTEGTRQDYMEGLQYNPSTAMTDTAILRHIPDLYCRTLIWDLFAFESFAWSHFDSLQLNIPYHARKYNTNISLAGMGNFSNHDVKLAWTGISIMNKNRCALLQFEAMENPLTIKTTTTAAKGRSHYWGNIWVSLTNKQLEGVRMNEDVMLEMELPGMGKRMINTIRSVNVERLKD